MTSVWRVDELAVGGVSLGQVVGGLAVGTVLRRESARPLERVCSVFVLGFDGVSVVC